MKDPREKLHVLKGSLESGAVEKDEYEREKEKLDPEIKEFEKKIEEKGKEPAEEPKKTSDKALIFTIAVIVLLLASVFLVSTFLKQRPKTLEELHVLNLQGKLKPEQGYVYKEAYSFINYDSLWYTQLTSPKGTKVYDLALRYSPNDLKDIVIEGNLDKFLFDEKNEFYVTFNPNGTDFSYVSLAAADFGTHMSKVFEKNPIASCDRNVTETCKTRPIVTCDDKDKLVLYIKESERQRSYYNGNCMVIEGKGLDLVKGVDRVLYNLYSIMKQEEQ